MRRPAKAALALTSAITAALALQAGAADAASSGPVVTFTRGTVSQPSAARAFASTRIWSIFRGTLGDVTGDGGQTDDVQIPVLPTSLPRDSFARLQLLHAAGLATDADTLQAALKELELPFMFAGRQQWVMNLTSPDGAASDPRLWNVSMESPVSDEASMRLLLGRAAWAVEQRRPMAEDVAYWKSLVPAWAPKVRDDLAAQGIPFSVELLASPEMEIYDAAKPLFPLNAHPVSLFQLGSFQTGESAFLRSLSAEELMDTVYPMYYRIHHRAAGAPVPAELAVGLDFGNVVAESCSENTANGCIDGIRYRHSPLMESDPYLRWQAYGTPGVDTNGFLLDTQTGWGWNPLTGEFKSLEPPTNSWRVFRLNQFTSGAVQPSYIASGWNEFVMDGLNSPITAAGFLQDPSIWFQGVREKFAPDKLDADTKARYLALEADASNTTSSSDS
jgi:hypothetical protein